MTEARRIIMGDEMDNMVNVEIIIQCKMRSNTVIKIPHPLAGMCNLQSSNLQHFLSEKCKLTLTQNKIQ